MLIQLSFIIFYLFYLFFFVAKICWYICILNTWATAISGHKNIEVNLVKVHYKGWWRHLGLAAMSGFSVSNIYSFHGSEADFCHIEKIIETLPRIWNSLNQMILGVDYWLMYLSPFSKSDIFQFIPEILTTSKLNYILFYVVVVMFVSVRVQNVLIVISVYIPCTLFSFILSVNLLQKNA